MYGAGIAFVTTMVVSNGIGAEGSASFFRLMALFAISISLVTFGADTGLVRTMSAQRALGRYGVLPQLIRYGLIPSLVTSVLLVAGVYMYQACADGSCVSGGNARQLRFCAVSGVDDGVLRRATRSAACGDFTLLQNVLLPTLRLAAVGLVVLFSGQLMDLVYAWTIPVAITAVVALWLWSVRSLLRSMWRFFLLKILRPRTFRSFWGFSSARVSLPLWRLSWSGLTCWW